MHRPTSITADRYQRLLIVTWSDGHESRYPFALLRHGCPCAECRGGHANMSNMPDPAVFTLEDEDTTATQLENIEAVGGYAITISWADGHHYGIYRWDYLRALCPCPECRQT